MRNRLVAVVLLCGASASLLADPARDRISSERNAANAKLAAQERECSNRFIVAPCIEDARNEHRDVISRLRQQELQLDENRRREAAEARRKAIAERAEAQQARASDPAADAPRIRVRRPPTPPAAGASRPAVDIPMSPKLDASEAPGRALLLIFPQIMTTVEPIMRCADTWQVLGGMHGDEAIGRIGTATLASRSDVAGGQDAGAGGASCGCGPADRVHVEGGA